MTIRFIHTSDWQLGLKLAYIPQRDRARALEARFQAVERIAALAETHDVHAVVVAGDVFDDNAVGRDVLQKTLDALSALGNRPVLLLPGNHDPATPDAALARLRERPGFRETLHVLDRATPFTAIDGVTFYPAPLTRRDPQEDPSAWIPAASSGDREAVRVAVVHGSALDFSEAGESTREIDTQRLLERGMDYVALGDWHGTLRLGPRVWYSGTPEATRFKEKEPGFALLVEIDGPGEKPRVTPLTVGRTRWIQETRALDSSDDLGAFETWLRSLVEPSWTLLELSLTGALSYAELNRLDGLLEEAAEALLWLKVERNDVRVAPTDEDLARLHAEGFIGDAVQALREAAPAAAARDEGPEDGAEVDVPTSARAAQDALRLLYRLLDEEGAP